MSAQELMEEMYRLVEEGDNAGVLAFSELHLAEVLPHLTDHQLGEVEGFGEGAVTSLDAEEWEAARLQKAA